MLEALATAALRTLALALVVELCLRAMRIRHSQMLLAAWIAVLAASLVMPFLQSCLQIAVPTAADLPLPFSDGTAPFNSQLPAAARVADVAMSAYDGLPWKLWLEGAYVAIAAAMMLRLLAGVALSWHLVRTSRPAWEAWSTGARMHTSSLINAPVTIGAHILLPEDWMQWSAATQRAVLAHERAHVASGDFYVLLVSQVNRAMFWFSPLAWWLHHRLASLVEQISDDAATAALDDRADYAAILLDMARRSGPIRGGVAMARPATLCQRIERILAEPESPQRVGGAKRLALAFGVASLALVAALSVVADASLPKMPMLAEQMEPHTRIAIDPKKLDAYAGFYFSPTIDSVMEVTREGDHILTRWAGKSATAGYPYTDHDFFQTVAPIQNSFITDASGDAVQLVHHERGSSETLERISDDEGRRLAAAVAQRLTDERKPHVSVQIDPNLLDNYVGSYEISPQLVYTVTRSGNILSVKRTGQRGYLVHPYSDHDFFYTVFAAQISFVTGDDGKAIGLILHENGRDRSARRVDPAMAQALDRKIAEERAPHRMIAIDPHLIDLYVGRYVSGREEIIATRDGDQLFVEATGSGRYAVYPYTDHDFFATLAPTQISFIADGTNKATQLIQHARGMDTVLKRAD